MRGLGRRIERLEELAGDGAAIHSQFIGFGFNKTYAGSLMGEGGSVDDLNDAPCQAPYGTTKTT